MGDRLTNLKVEVEQYLNNSDFDNAFCAVSTFVDSILHPPRATGKVPWITRFGHYLPDDMDEFL
jgi:hypothetical protein